MYILALWWAGDPSRVSPASRPYAQRPLPHCDPENNEWTGGF